jgi:hypothetical protein
VRTQLNQLGWRAATHQSCPTISAVPRSGNRTAADLASAPDVDEIARTAQRITTVANECEAALVAQ